MTSSDAGFTGETLTLSVDGHVGEITLTRPDLLNRFDEEVHHEFAEALHRVAASPDVRAVVLASTGKVFSAGGDFDFMRKGHEDLPFLLHHEQIGRDLLLSLVDLRVPIVSAVQGAAIGLGATVALACDCIVAARSAVLADPHVQIGLAAGDGGCLVWPLAVGPARAKRFLLTGDRLSAGDAYQFGLVTDLVDTPEETVPAARALAGKMAALPPLAVQGTKMALRNIMRARAAEVVDLAFSYEIRSAGADDLLEAIDAFKGKRPGVYRGR
ncbi:MAG TPA: enoyl-CoA hydratase/isomerase family protein [Acidimicrobiia bacterium]|nr:enoyl-CoA hydratase/isomerase family protein [Acidimicrobiia bacterium]